MKAFRLGVIVLLCAGLAQPVEANPTDVVYVDDDARPGGDGRSWDSAYRYLQDALADANSLPAPVEIRVAQGVYRPDQGQGYVAGDRSATFHLVNGASLKGGYVGLGAPDPNARDQVLYETILSGDLLGDDEGNPPGLEDNSRRIVQGWYLDKLSQMDGFTIAGGTGWNGSGISLVLATAAVSNCLFVNNQSGLRDGVLTCSKADAILVNCTLVQNHGGNGVYLDKSDAALRGCKIGAHDEHGLYGWDSNVVVVDSSFHENGRCGMKVDPRSTLAVAGSRFTGNKGGGIRCPVPLTVTRSWFEGNSGDGAIDCWASVSATDCTFLNNICETGVAVSGWDVMVLERCRFSGNRGVGAGAVRASNGNLVANGCVFTGNLGRGKDGAIKTGAATTLTNCTFYGHRNQWATQTNAIVHTGRFMQLNQCIIRDGNPIDAEDPDRVYVRYSNISGGWPGPGNIDIDPCFVDPGYWADPNDPNVPAGPDDPDAVWIDGDYHLQSQAGRWDPSSETWVQDDLTSPCIDAGDPVFPIGGEPFPNGGRANMGVYAGTAEASKSFLGEPVCETIIAGDINGDCRVDGLDLAAVASKWLLTGDDFVNKPPTVRITSPLDGAELLNPYTLTPRAEARDPDGSVVRVVFKKVFQEDHSTTGTWCTDRDGLDGWSCGSTIERGVPPSERVYTITAQAFDDDGATSAESQITVTVVWTK